MSTDSVLGSIWLVRVQLGLGAPMISRLRFYSRAGALRQVSWRVGVYPERDVGVGND